MISSTRRVLVLSPLAWALAPLFAPLAHAASPIEAGGVQWMGFRPSLPDSLPVIGPSRASPHILYAFGHGHLGLTQSAATGRLVADLLTGQELPLDPAPFRPGRF